MTQACKRACCDAEDEKLEALAHKQGADMGGRGDMRHGEHTTGDEGEEGFRLKMCVVVWNALSVGWVCTQLLLQIINIYILF